jgi:large subunit ribosomal protein L5
MTETYTSEVVPALIKQFGYSSQMAVPRVTKVVVNMGMGDAIQDGKAMDAAVEELAGITGQKPTVTRARKSIANLPPRGWRSVRATLCGGHK